MLITGAGDLMDAMGWRTVAKPAPSSQRQLFVTLDASQQQIAGLFEPHEEKHFNEICRQMPIPGSQVAKLVLDMEMQHVLKSLPGQRYQLA